MDILKKKKKKNLKKKCKKILEGNAKNCQNKAIYEYNFSKIINN